MTVKFNFVTLIPSHPYGIGVLYSIQFRIASVAYDNKLIVSNFMWSAVKCKQLTVLKVYKGMEGNLN